MDGFCYSKGRGKGLEYRRKEIGMKNKKMKLNGNKVDC